MTKLIWLLSGSLIFLLLYRASSNLLFDLFDSFPTSAERVLLTIVCLTLSLSVLTATKLKFIPISALHLGGSSSLVSFAYLYVFYPAFSFEQALWLTWLQVLIDWPSLVNLLLLLVVPSLVGRLLDGLQRSDV